MKKGVILIVLIILISNISFALEPGRLWINDVEIPYSLEKELEKPTISKQISYVYANGQRIAKVENGEVFYFHNDHLGSPRVITDSNGNVVEKIDYLPFGAEFSSSNEKIKYNSKELDSDTNLHYYGARYYNAPVGRFITADTVKGELVDPQSLNLYVYTKNNPMIYIDLKGNIIFFAPGTEKYKSLIEKMDVYKKLHSNEKAFFEFMIDESLHEKGIFAGFASNIFSSVFSSYPKGTVYVPLLSKAKERASIKEIKTMLYHELFHAQQEVWISDYFSKRNNYATPEWKIEFYYARLSDKQADIHLGLELEAHYKTILYEKKEFGKVEWSSINLGSFFMYLIKTQRTKEYSEYEEIRNLVSVYSNVIKQITGYDLESYIREFEKREKK